MEIVWLVIGLVVGLLAGGGAVFAYRRTRPAASSPATTSRWPLVLVPTLVGVGMQAELPQQAMTAAYELTGVGTVLFYIFIEVPRNQPLNVPLVAETDAALRQIEAAEEQARLQGRQLRGEVQKVRDYAGGVVDVVRQTSAKAVVLQAEVHPHRPEERGQRASNLRPTNTTQLAGLIHGRAGCDVLVVG